MAILGFQKFFFVKHECRSSIQYLVCLNGSFACLNTLDKALDCHYLIIINTVIMVNKKIEHPLRTIELAYDELKPFHPFEEEMLDRYTLLHNFVKELCEDYNSVQHNYEMHDEHIRKVINRFRALKGRMNHIEAEAKQVLNSMLPDKDQANNIIQQTNDFKLLLKGFHVEVEKLSIESDTMHQLFIPLDNKDERLSEIFKEYKEFREELYDNCDNYSLDVNQYDSDEQAFLGSLTDMAGKQTEFIEVCNIVIDRYNFLIEEVEKTYEQWNKCIDMIDMLRKVMVTPYDMNLICLN
jgi:chromosome segregation ATPase